MQDVEGAGRPWYRKLHWQIVLGIAFGFVYALSVRAMYPIDASAMEAAASKEALAAWASAAAIPSFVGDLFIRALKMIIIPLIVASVVTGIRSLGDTSALGRVGVRTIVYYMATTLMAVTIGIIVVNVIQPGVGLNLSFAEGKTLKPTPLLDVFRNIIPTSALGAFAGNKMLPSIFVSILIGLGLLSIGEEGEPVARFFESLNALVLRITDWIMMTAPLGVAALFIKALLDPRLASVAAYLRDLGAYMVAVIAGLLIHAVIALPLLLFIFTRRSPLAFARAMAPGLLTAFSTASSAATYPVTLECVTEGAGVSKKSANFVLPLGATINMDGTALYEAVAAIFIANAIGMPLTFEQQLIVVITATLAAIGAAGVPSAGLVTMIIVLESVGLPGAAYGLVIAVDRLLDMCRTTVNVWGDSIGAAIVGEWVDDDPAPQAEPDPSS